MYVYSFNKINNFCKCLVLICLIGMPTRNTTAHCIKSKNKLYYGTFMLDFVMLQFVINMLAARVRYIHTWKLA